MAVDTHVFRVGNRTGLAPGKNPLEVELELERAIPAEFMLHAHHWLILHGRYTCVARKPRCEVCIINDLCRWPEKTAARPKPHAGCACRLDQFGPRAGQPLVHVDHEGHAEQRRREIDDRDRDERCDDAAGGKHGCRILLAERLRLFQRAEAHRGELEIFAAEQLGGSDEEHDNSQRPQRTRTAARPDRPGRRAAPS